MKLSIDEENLSINALELFTRKEGTNEGLSKAVGDLIEICVQRQKT